MKVLYLHQYFRTPAMCGGTRSFEVARRLVEWGHEVHILTALTDHTESWVGWRRTDECGIDVHWYGHRYTSKLSYKNRFKAFCRFAFAATLKALRMQYDLVYATSTPLTIAIPGLIAATSKRVPMVFEVRDLWPEVPIQIGALKSRYSIALARALEKCAYSQAAHIIALSPGMASGIVKTGVVTEKVSVVPNGCDLSLFDVHRGNLEWRNKLGLGDKFVCLYCGSMGVIHGLDFVLDTASLLLKEYGNPPIAFVLFGDGQMRAHLERRVRVEHLDNVQISGPASKEQVRELFNVADVCLSMVADVPILHTCSPNKLFDAFAAGKPVIVNSPGWLQEIVETNCVGMFVSPGNLMEFAEKILYLSTNREVCKQLGRNARQLAEERFSRDVLVHQVEDILRKCIGPACKKSY